MATERAAGKTVGIRLIEYGRAALARRALAPAALSCVALVVLAVPASAATFTVDSPADVVDVAPGDGNCATTDETCTLRAAAEEANSFPGADVIVLPAGDYQLTAVLGQLRLQSDIDLRGAGRGTTRILGLDGHRVAKVTATNEIDEGEGANTVTVSEVTFAKGQRDGNGGGVHNSGDLTLTGVVVRENLAGDDGGGVYNLGELALEGAAVIGNVSGTGDSGDGGGIANRGEASVRRSDISGNGAFSNGGGVANGFDAELSIEESSVRGNGSEQAGGGVFNQSTLNITNTAIIGNGGDKDISLGEGNLVGFDTQIGGGLANLPGQTRADAKLTNVTVDGNEAFEGGGIYNAASFIQIIAKQLREGEVGILGEEVEGPLAPRVSLVNATVTSNALSDSKGTPGEGTNIFNEGPPEVTLLGFPGFTSGVVNLKNTIVALGSQSGDENCGGADPQSQGNNLEERDTCDLGSTAGDGDQVNTAPQLDDLADALASSTAAGRYGLVRALQSGSPAINTANNDGCPSRDQRGVSRPEGERCDIGAYEVVVATTSNPQLEPQPGTAGQQSDRPTVRTSGVPRACASRAFGFQVNVRGVTATRMRSVEVYLDGKRIVRTTRKRFTVKVAVRSLSRTRKHQLRVVAVDPSGDRDVVRSRTFARCAQVAPRFTG